MADLLTGLDGDGLRVAMVGCGGIAEFHAAAFRAAGFHLAGVCGTPGSERARAFARTHEIERVYDDPRDLFSDRSAIDGVLIAVPVEATLGLLKLAVAAGIPTLVEKPVAYGSEPLKPLLDLDALVIVGYNRRFYRTVKEARDEAAREPPALAHLVIPESVRAPDTIADDPAYLRPYFANSVHGLDLARFVFGDLHVEHVQRSTNSGGVVTGIAATLTAPHGAVVQFTANWGAPANFSLTLDRPGRRYDLKPFESATVFEGMDIVEPGPQTPIRTYRPRVSNTVPLDEADYRFKPGFVAQAHAFAALIRDESPEPAARLSDAHAALKLAEKLAGQTFPVPTRGV